MISNLPKYITFSLILLSTACNSDEKIVEDYCKTAQTCEGDLGLDEGETCEDSYALDSEASCYEEERAFRTCISALSCEQYDVWLSESEENYPCKSEETAWFDC